MTKSASKNIQSPRVNVYKTCAHHPDKELRNDYMNKTFSMFSTTWIFFEKLP